MTKKLYIVAFILSVFTNVYADVQDNIQQGAQKYDWQTCVTTKADYCVNNTCATSDDPNCRDNCNSMAKDKCQSEGLSSPQ